MIIIKKIIIALILTVVLTFSLGVHAQGELNAELTDAVAITGRTFKIDLNVTSNPGVAAMYYKVEYDSRYFTLVTAEDTGLFDEFLFSDNDGTLWLSWESAVNSLVTGTAAELVFRTSKDAPEDIYDFTLTAPQVFDAGTSQVNVELNSSKITVQKPRFSIYVDIDTSADAFLMENTVCVEVNGDNTDFSVDGNKITFIADEGDSVKLKFNAIGAEGEYIPVYIKYTENKIPFSYSDNAVFTAYGKECSITAKYEMAENAEDLIELKYEDVSKNRITIEKFYEDENVKSHLQNAPELYGRVLRGYLVGNTEYASVNDAVSAIENGAREVVLIYESKSENTGCYITVNKDMAAGVNGVAVSGKVAPYTLVKFVADYKDGTFSYWEDSQGNIVSYNIEYSLYVISDVNIHPVYNTAVKDAIINVRVADNQQKLVLVADRSASDNVTVTEHGILIAEFETDQLTLDMVGMQDQGKVYIGRKNNTMNNGTYILTKGDKHSEGGTYSEKGTTLSAVGYLKYTDADGVEKLIYSKIVKAVVE